MKYKIDSSRFDLPNLNLQLNLGKKKARFQRKQAFIIFKKKLLPIRK